MTDESPDAHPITRAKGAAGAPGGHAYTNGLVAAPFAVTGPLAVLLNVAIDARLSRALNSWILASCVIGGLLPVLLSLRYRQPLALAWTIPRVVLIVPALRDLAFEEVVGAYLATGVVLVLLGVTGGGAPCDACHPVTDHHGHGRRDLPAVRGRRGRRGRQLRHRHGGGLLRRTGDHALRPRDPTGARVAGRFPPCWSGWSP